MVVLGVDGARVKRVSGWVAVVADDGVLEARFLPDFLAVLDLAREQSAAAVAVDIPIGHEARRRQADAEARCMLAPKLRSSMFPAVHGTLLSCADYAEARALAREQGLPVPSAQAWGLVGRMQDVERTLSGASGLVYEVHPEVSFAAMAREHDLPVPDEGRKTWNGQQQRRLLLKKAGLQPHAAAGLQGVAADDVLDAAGAAWTARRIERKEAHTYPPMPQPGQPAIWC